MTIEKLIADNTAALRELTAAIQAGVKVEKVAPVAPAVQESAPGALTQMTAVEAEQATFNAAANDGLPTYEQASAAVTKLAKAKGRDAAVAILAKFGAAKLPDVMAEQYAALIAEAEKDAA